MIDEVLGHPYAKHWTILSCAQNGTLLPWSSTLPVFDYEEEKTQLSKAQVALHARVSDPSHLMELHKWRVHTKTMHMFAGVPKMLERIGVRKASQAFAKASEIYHFMVLPYLENSLGMSLQSFIQYGHIFKTLHLCECPGDFVSALSHIISVNDNLSPITWKWTANSLNPHCEYNAAENMLLQDQLIVDYPNNWWFGADGSGDVIKYRSESIQDGPFHLVTADGSFYVQDRPQEQESLLKDLLFAEVELGVRNLTINGILVFKAYSFATKAMKTLLSYLMEAFKEVHFFKPLCSKPGNAEKYIICLGFTGAPLSSFTEQIGEQCGPSSQQCLLIERAEASMVNLQTEAIVKNLEAFRSETTNEAYHHAACHRDTLCRQLLTFLGYSPPTGKRNAQDVARLADRLISLECRNEPCWHRVTHFPNLVECLQAVSDRSAAVNRMEARMAEQAMRVENNNPGLALFDKRIPLSSDHITVSSHSWNPVTPLKHSLFVDPECLRCLRIISSRGPNLDAFLHVPLKLEFLNDKFEAYESVVLHSQSDAINFLAMTLNWQEVPQAVQIVQENAELPAIFLSRFSFSFLCILSRFYQRSAFGKERLVMWSKAFDGCQFPDDLKSHLCNLSTVSDPRLLTSYAPIDKEYSTYEVVYQYNNLVLMDYVSTLIYKCM